MDRNEPSAAGELIETFTAGLAAHESKLRSQYAKRARREAPETARHVAELRAARQALVDATEGRIEAIRAARADGVTWRKIAAALEITEQGVHSLLRTRDNRKTTKNDNEN